MSVDKNHLNLTARESVERSEKEGESSEMVNKPHMTTKFLTPERQREVSNIANRLVEQHSIRGLIIKVGKWDVYLEYPNGGSSEDIHRLTLDIVAELNKIGLTLEYTYGGFDDESIGEQFAIIEA